ncbi:MAG TPA: HD domain-containing protein [Acidimicrobiia bacterium]|nr:HD domain-containing protein [Acidimicrobiia bacterium]
MAEIEVGKRFFDAAQWATELHTDASRTPSVAQVLGVASLVLGDGGSQREAIAGMIVDASRAGSASNRVIRQRIGKKAAKVVAGCTAALADIDLLDDAEPSVLRVCAAVTLHDAHDLVREVRRHGSVAFARFDTPPDAILERYRTLVPVFHRRLGRKTMLTPELRAVLGELERDAELDTATAAWRVAHVDAA